MGIEDELRVELARAMGVGMRARNVTDGDLEELLALLPPLSVLSWITANPEAAKGLAEGKAVVGYWEVDPAIHRRVIKPWPPAPSGKAQGET